MNNQKVSTHFFANLYFYNNLLLLVVAAFADIANPICASGATGSLSLYASGGTGTYKYSINDGAFSDDVNITSLHAGEYTIVAQDINQCISSVITKTLIDPQGTIYKLDSLLFN